MNQFKQSVLMNPRNVMESLIAWMVVMRKFVNQLYLRILMKIVLGKLLVVLLPLLLFFVLVFLALFFTRKDKQPRRANPRTILPLAMDLGLKVSEPKISKDTALPVTELFLWQPRNLATIEPQVTPKLTTVVT